jgi:hypothetical protein
VRKVRKVRGVRTVLVRCGLTAGAQVRTVLVRCGLTAGAQVRTVLVRCGLTAGAKVRTVPVRSEVRTPHRLPCVGSTAPWHEARATVRHSSNRDARGPVTERVQPHRHPRSANRQRPLWRIGPRRRSMTTRSVLAAAAFVLTVAAAAFAQPGDPPTTLAIDGGGSLPLAGHAVRAHLVGTVPAYVISLYFDGPVRDRARLASPAAAKAMRIEVTFASDLERRFPVEWRRELVPRLDPAAERHLYGTFAALRRGDVVTVAYSSAARLSVHVNDTVVVSRGHHDVMLAFLDHWVGQRPVSEEIKAMLLAGP